MKIVHGDLLQLAKAGVFDVIIHGCNCFCTFGAGIASQIKKEFPEAYLADCATAKGHRGKLGHCTSAVIKIPKGEVTVVNAYTQFYWGGEGPLADLDAIRNCMAWIKYSYPGRRIGIPRIGAGLAGGDWAVISGIINEELEGEDLTLVEYQPPSSLWAAPPPPPRKCTVKVFGGTLNKVAFDTKEVLAVTAKSANECVVTLRGGGHVLVPVPFYEVYNAVWGT